MPRFTDTWVMDRVLFDYMSGGSCSCCGIAYSSMLFGNTNDLIRAASDLDEVAVHSETNALEQWPKDLRDQVWADRIRLRQKLKISRKAFQKKLEPLLLLDSKDTIALEFPLRLSKEAFLQHLQDRYKVHSAFVAVLECVLEQIANFELTKYDLDGEDEDERAFEANLRLVRNTFELSDEDIFRRRCAGMTRGKLLPTKTLDRPLDVDTVPKPSFASDRRLIRLVLARYWAEEWIDRTELVHDVR
jgi:hypothetical protein